MKTSNPIVNKLLNARRNVEKYGLMIAIEEVMSNVNGLLTPDITRELLRA